MTGPAWLRVIFAALIFCALLPASGENAVATYRPPDTQQPIFDVSRLKFNEKARAQTATMLATSLHGSQPPYAQPELELFAHVLGLALQLDPYNRSAIICNGKLKKGLPLPRSARTTSRKTVAANLAKLAKMLRQQKSPEDAKLASYFVSLGQRLDQHNDDLLFEGELLTEQGLVPDWSFVTGTHFLHGLEASRAPDILPGMNLKYAAEPKTFVRRQQTVKSLMVGQAPSGRMVGVSMDVILTVEPPRVDPESRVVQFARPVGDEMLTSCNEAVRTVKVRYPEWEDATIRVSFSDKYSSKDGGSAGAAFTLGLLGLLDGVTYDERFVMTGEVTVDWKVRRVGGVPEKVRAAIVDRYRIVAVPEENKADVVNLAVLYSPRALWDTQIFSVETIVDAVRLGRSDKPRAISEAIAKFAKIQAHLSLHPDPSTLTQPDVRKQLSEVVELAPNHLSAQLLLLAGEQKLPENMSFMASMEHLFLALGPLTPDIFSQQVIREVPLIRAEFDQTLRQLNEAQTKVHPRTRPLLQSMVQFSQASAEMDRVSKARIGLSEKRNRFDQLGRRREKARHDIHAYMNAISNNQQFIERLMKM